MVPKALIVKSDILPYSETFIREQISACVRWRAMLVGERIVRGVSLEGIDTRVLATNLRLVKIFNFLGIAYPGHVQALLDEHADLVHVHFGTEAVKFWPTIRRLKLPMVVTLHGSDITIRRDWWEQHGGPVGRKYPRRLLRLAGEDRVFFVAVSNAIKQNAIEFGIPAGRISVRYIGIDTAKFSPAGRPISERRRRIIYIGRLVEKKGVRYLIQAFARVIAAIPDAELRIIGDGPLLEELRTLAGALPVEFTGKMSSTQVRQEILEARVLCLPSVTAENGDAEGLGMVNLEAQASGVPVVTSSSGGAAEGIWHGVTGFATAPKDPVALSEALLEILRNDAKAEEMSRAATQFVLDKFDLRHCTARLEEFYDTIHQGGRP